MNFPCIEPEKAFLCLKENYGAVFDCVALKSKLLVR
jgi:hypothetical protein